MKAQSVWQYGQATSAHGTTSLNRKQVDDETPWAQGKGFVRLSDLMQNRLNARLASTCIIFGCTMSYISRFEHNNNVQRRAQDES
jgi:hypothetical protein